MSRHLRIPPTAAGALLAVAALGTGTASAHNAGCVETPNGVIEVGSNKDSPLVSPNAPSRWNADRGGYELDLEEGPGDQYGARYAADQGNSAVRPPDHCRETTAQP